MYRSDLKISEKVQQSFSVSSDFEKKFFFSVAFAVFGLHLDDILSEFREN